MKKKFKLSFFLSLVISLLLSFTTGCSKTSEPLNHWIGAWNGGATDFTFF